MCHCKIWYQFSRTVCLTAVPYKSLRTLWPYQQHLQSEVASKPNKKIILGVMAGAFTVPDDFD